MQVEWALSIVIPIFKGKGDIRSYSSHRHEGGGKGARKNPSKKVTVNEMQFCFMTERNN